MQLPFVSEGQLDIKDAQKKTSIVAVCNFEDHCHDANKANAIQD
jgi:hypothetical protein